MKSKMSEAPIPSSSSYKEISDATPPSLPASVNPNSILIDKSPPSPPSNDSSQPPPSPLPSPPSSEEKTSPPYRSLFEQEAINVSILSPPNSSSPATEANDQPVPPQTNTSSEVTPSTQVSQYNSSLLLNATPSKSTASTPLSDNVDSSSRNSHSFSLPHHDDRVLIASFAGILVVLIVAFIVIFEREKRKIAKILPTQQCPHDNFSRISSGYYYRSADHCGWSPRLYAPKASPCHSPNVSFRTPANFSGLRDAVGLFISSWFTYEELMDATNGFSEENLIGEGGFGRVHKGWLPNGKCVAVKQLKAINAQGEIEFRAEVEIISRVHHRNLVGLVGCAITQHQWFLVYEFAPNGTLEQHLNGKELQVLDWPKRLKIAVGAARGLAYLHEDCQPRIIHRDIKSANILLNYDYEAKVADFGLAKLTNDFRAHVSTLVMGTFGYMAPEYASSGKLTDKSDVFSFGVVLLELITGRKSVDQSQPLGEESIVEWARPILIRALETGDCGELADPRLENNYDETEMLRMIEVAAACTRHSAPKRPRMAQVVRTLYKNEEMTDVNNGVKVGLSRVFNSAEYSIGIQMFLRRTVPDDGIPESEEYDELSHSGYTSSADHLHIRMPISPKLGEHGSYAEDYEKCLITPKATDAIGRIGF